MNTDLIKPHDGNFTANKGNKERFFVNFVAFCKASLCMAILALPVPRVQAAVVLTTVHAFNGANDGANPQAGLIQGTDGSFYGTTSGGQKNYGTVFKISPNGELTKLYAFGKVTNASGLALDGAGPEAPLVQGNDGYFYGTTEYGGASNYGTLFKISANGSFSSFYSFTGTNDGAGPVGLLQGSDGRFYGATYAGGTNNFGTVFAISANGALTTLYSFTGGNDGANPMAGPAQGGDGNFYGTTYGGGTMDWGTVFAISANGALTNLYSFGSLYSPYDAYSLDGTLPTAGLVQGSDGNFYGTTGFGGTNNDGTVFKISTNGAMTTLCAFGNAREWVGTYLVAGEYPVAGVVEGSDGYFYGTSSQGGAYTNRYGYGYGTVFKISASGVFSNLYSFTGGADGAYPSAAMVQGSDGVFYGTTEYGGANGYGTVFRLTVVPEFQAVTLTNGVLSLTWSTEAGGKYQLQCNSDLSPSNWVNLGNPFLATGATLSTTDSITNAPQRFYRLVLSP